MQISTEALIFCPGSTELRSRRLEFRCPSPEFTSEQLRSSSEQASMQFGSAPLNADLGGEPGGARSPQLTQINLNGARLVGRPIIRLLNDDFTFLTETVGKYLRFDHV